MPTLKELESIVKRNLYDSVLPAEHPFIDIKDSYYWSSSSQRYSEESMWIVRVYFGGVYSCNVSGDCYVWPVRVLVLLTGDCPP